MFNLKNEKQGKSNKRTKIDQKWDLKYQLLTRQ
jgi:hypothetical protein